MNKKQYACIQTSKETMAAIQKLSENPSDPVAALNEINKLAARWNKDFQGVAPSWQHPAAESRPDADKMAMAVDAFIQE